MSYNGIGLMTPRGTGTSGYVMRSNAFLKYEGKKKTWADWKGDTGKVESLHKKVNPELDRHEKMRAIELELLEIKDKMQAAGIPERQREERVNSLRKEKRAELDAKLKMIETGELKEAPAKRLDDFRSAFEIDSEYKHGNAFDRDLQEDMRLERLATREREAADEAMRELKAELEIKKHESDKKKAEKKAEKAKKKEEKKKAKAAKKAAKHKAEVKAEEKPVPSSRRKEEPKKKKKSRRARSTSSSSSGSSSFS